MMNGRLWFGCLLVVATSIFAGCSAYQLRSVSPGDNPGHHFQMGMELLESGKYESARDKLERAVFCDPRFSPAYAGLAILAAEKASQQTDEGYRNADLDRSAENLGKALSYSTDGNDTFVYFLAVMRVNSAGRDEGWLKKVRDAYRHAMAVNVRELRYSYYGGGEAASFYMGLACLQAGELNEARQLFARVVEAGPGKWYEKAECLWKKADNASRALSVATAGSFAKKIANSESVTRGDLSALLVEELLNSRFFGGPVPIKPQEVEAGGGWLPVDVTGHHFREEIVTVLNWRVRGLEPLPDETSGALLFRPGDIVTRGEMALVLEDILIRVTRGESIATAYLGQDTSPFPDVRKTSSLFNAVMTVTSRGILATEITGEFRPGDPVSGADALLAIMTVKNKFRTL
jgi:Tfp pilus assembly protein PilF